MKTNTSMKSQPQIKNQPTNETTIIQLLTEIRDLLESRLKKPIDTSIFHNK